MNEYGRRQLLFFLGAAGVSLILDSCRALNRKPPVPTLEPMQERIYDGPIDNLRGLRLIDTDLRNQLVYELKFTGFPFFKKIATEIYQLTIARQVPPTLPPTITQSSIPLNIVYNRDSRFTAPIRVEAKPPSDVSDFYIIDKAGQTRSREIQKVDFAIKLGLGAPNNPVDNLSRSLYLARMYTFLMLAFGNSLAFYDYIQEGGLGKATDVNGQEIADKARQSRVGQSIYFGNFTNRAANPIFFDTVSNLSTLIVAAGLRDYVLQQPRGATLQLRAQQFVVAAEILEERRDAFSKIAEIINQWVGTNTLTSPSLALRESLRNPLYSAEVELGKELRARGLEID